MQTCIFSKKGLFCSRPLHLKLARFPQDLAAQDLMMAGNGRFVQSGKRIGLVWFSFFLLILLRNEWPKAMLALSINRRFEIVFFKQIKQLLASHRYSRLILSVNQIRFICKKNYVDARHFRRFQTMMEIDVRWLSSVNKNQVCGPVQTQDHVIMVTGFGLPRSLQSVVLMVSKNRLF